MPGCNPFPGDNESLKPTVTQDSMDVVHNANADQETPVYMGINLANQAKLFVNGSSNFIFPQFDGGLLFVVEGIANAPATYDVLDQGATPTVGNLFVKPGPKGVGEFFSLNETVNADTYFEANNNDTITRMPVRQMTRSVRAITVNGIPNSPGTYDFHLGETPDRVFIREAKIISETGTTGSDGSNNFSFQIRNISDSLNLAATAKNTNGAEITANTPYSIGLDQNRLIARNKDLVLRVVVTGTPTDLSAANIVLNLEFYDLTGLYETYTNADGEIQYAGTESTGDQRVFTVQGKAVRVESDLKGAEDKYIYFNDATANADERLECNNGSSGDLTFTSEVTDNDSYNGVAALALYIDPTAPAGSRLYHSFGAVPRDFYVPAIGEGENAFVKVQYTASVVGMYRVYWSAGNSQFEYNNTATQTDTTINTATDVRPSEAIQPA